MTVDISVATYGERIHKIRNLLLPPAEGVRYVVSWQRYSGVDMDDALSARGDVDIYRYDGMGQSGNRNNSLEHCSADIVILADDDIIYSHEAVSCIRDIFGSDPSLDLVTFRASYPYSKPYPESSCRLTLPLPGNYWVSTFEISFRRCRLGDLRFNPQFGLDSPLFGCGEDEMFLISAIKRGLDCRFFPLTICRHPEETTGCRISPSILRAQGVLMSVVYPYSLFLRIPLKAWRVSRRYGMNLFLSLRYLISGALKKGRLLKSPRCYRW